MYFADTPELCDLVQKCFQVKLAHSIVTRVQFDSLIVYEGHLHTIIIPI